MIRFLGLIALVLLSTLSWGQNVDTANISITNFNLNPGTYSFRGTGTYHDMTSWDSSPYTEGHLRQGSAFRMNYRLLYPTEYETDPNAEGGYPLIVMMHGLGEGGTCWGNCDNEADVRYLSNDLQLAHGGQAHLTARNRTPAHHPRSFHGFVLFPQSGSNNGWDNNSLNNAVRIIRLLTRQLNIDQNRIYVHGLSNGGQGALNLVWRADWLFAAAAPMSAIASHNALRAEVEADSLTQIPFWFFQGGQDTGPPPNYTEQTVRIMRAAGMSVRYSLYPTIGHGTWNTAYNEPDFFSWLLSKNKSDIHVHYDNATICGTTGAGAMLSLAQGFPAYQWELDGELISGANAHILEATVPGTYRARFSRVHNPTEGQWNQWSTPVDVTEVIPPKAEIEVIGTTHLRGPGLINAAANNTVVLRSNEPYDKYSWYKNGVLVDIPSNTQDDTVRNYTINSNLVSSNGAYTLVRSGFDNCPSPASDPVYLFFANSAPQNVGLVAPGNFQGTALSASSILLTWNDNSNLERAYEIWRRKPGENFSFVKRTNEDDISFLDTKLEPLTLYEYKIRAINNDGRSAYSPSDNINTNLQVTTLGDNVPPGTPQNFTAVASGIRQITLSWEAPSDTDLATYYLYFGSDSLAIDAPATSHVLSNLPLNATFNYTLKAMDESGKLSYASNQATANTYVTGLFYKHTTGAWNLLAEMEATWANPEFTGTVTNFSLTPRTQDNFFNFEFEGYIYITTAGSYEFQTTSDDGSQLRLNNNLIVNNDGLHGNVTVSSSTQVLGVGPHLINVRYFEKDGGESLTVRYRRISAPIINWTAIPNSMLQSGAPPVLTPPVAPTNLTAQSAGMTQIDLAWQYAGGNPAGLKVVVLGSSTAVGTGATAGNGWVNLLTNWLSSTTTGSSVTNLALGGFSSEDVMPNGSIPSPDVARNITYALSLNPNVIIVNLPTNDVAEGIPVATTINNFMAIKALADERGIPMFFTTSQPRNFGQEVDQTRRDLLQTTANEIRAAFGNYVIDIYDELTNFADRKLIKAEYNADGTHVNNAGHQYIFEIAQAKLMTYLTNFEVQRGLSVSGPFSLVGRSTSTTFNDTGLTPQTPYYYRVRTVNMNGTSPYTAVATATTGMDSEDPTQPLNLTYTGVTLSNVSLKWDVSSDNVGVTGYQIWANGSQIGTSTIPAYQASNLTPGTLYSFYVVAYDAVGNTSIPSAALEVSTLGSATYYSNASGSLSELTTWGSNPSGTGSNPSSFNINGIQLVVSNRTSTNLGGSLALPGAVSRLVVPPGITLNVDNVLNAKVEVQANGILNLNYAQQQPDLVVLAPASTVNYNYTSDAVFIKQTTYGNLGLSGAGPKTFTSGTTTILGNLIAASGVDLKGSIGNQTIINVGGNVTFTGTPGTTPRDFGVTLDMTANGTQTITTGGTLDLFQITKTGTGTVNLVNSGTPVTLNLGSNVGGGLSIPAGRVFNIANNTLALGGSARINGAGETGVLGVNGGSINLTSSSNSGSNLRFNPAANTISRLTVNLSGSGFANFYSAAKVTDAIKVTRGTLNPNGHLTLISTETQTANIERIENNGVITSSVRVQRFIDPKGRNYRYISSSVAGVTVANWQTYFDITGLFTGANTGGALSSNPSLFTFNGADYVAYPTTSNTEPIERGVGYALFNRNGTNPTLMETTGIPYQGTVPFAVVPNAGANSEAGWNLLGNPYASTIVWSMDNTAWPRTGMNTTVTVRENDGAVTQVYVWDALTSSGNLPGGRIAPGQAFWVQSMAAGASLSITEMAKSTGQQTHFREGADLISKLRINVSKGEKSDPAFIALTTVGTDKFDPEFDAVKQPNVGIFNFSTFSGDDNVALAINNSSDAFCSKTVKLNLRDVTPGTYTLSTENPETLFGVGAIILVDHFTNTTLDLRNTTSYSFDVTSDINSFGKDRFELVMHRPELDLSLQHTTAQVCGEAAPVTLESTQAGALYSIVNEKGEALSEVLTATGDALTLTVPKEMLRDGKNTFKVQTQFKGCTAAMLQSPVVVEYTTPPVANVAEFVSVCAGAPAVINVQHPDTGVSYKWYNGYQQSIAGVSSNTFTTSAVTMDTIYYVAAVSGKGCEGPKQMVIVTPEILEVPAVIPAGDTLYASASQGVQWFKNGESIFNATQPYYVPSTTGSYSVQVTKGGCIANSDEYVVNIESMVFPNPTSSANINFKFIADSDGNMKVSIVDLMGKKVHEDVFSAYDLAGGVKILPATKLNSGVYFLVVERNGFIRKVKFVLNE